MDHLRALEHDRQLLAAPQLRVETVASADHVLVLLHGDVDLTAVEPLASLREELAGRGLPVVVDASQVTFLDCAGLGAVLALTSDGTPASIVAASRPVRLLLDAAAGAGALPPTHLAEAGAAARTCWSTAGTARTPRRGPQR